MDYEILAGIIGALLALLFVLYARNKTRSPKNHFRNDPSVREEPDAISKAASGIYKAHKTYNRIYAFVIVAVVLVGAIFDSLTRIIVLSTVGLMLIIALIAKAFGARKNKSRKS